MNKRFSEFKSEVIAILTGEKGLIVNPVEVMKNNGVTLQGINIRRDTEENVAPTIYLEHYFEEYQNGREVEDIAEDIISTLKLNETNMTSKDIANFFTDWEKVKGQVFCHVIGRESNTDLLKDTPHKELAGIDDVVVVYRVLVPAFLAGARATILVKSSHLKAWGKTVDELNEVAMENTPKLYPARTQKMSDLLREMLASQGAPDFMLEEMTDMGDQPPMYVITNDKTMYGATNALVFDETLRNLADELDCDLIVLPSSIHEVIAIPVTKETENDPTTLLNMVAEVNTTQVAPEEVLTTNVYMFSRVDGIREFRAA